MRAMNKQFAAAIFFISFLLVACVQPSDWFSRAQMEFDQSDYLGAIVALNTHLQNGDSSCDALHLRATSYRRIGKWRLAALDLMRAQSKWPNCIDAKLELARVLSDSGDTAAAHAQLNKLNDATGTLGAEIQIEQALLAYKQDRFHQALWHLDRAIQSDTLNHLAWYYRGYLRSRFTDDDHSAGARITDLLDFDAAISDFSRCLLIDPKFADAWYQRGIVYLNMLNHQLGLRDLKQAIILEPNFSFYYTGRAEYFMRERDFLSAKKDLQKAILINPNDSLNRALLKRANDSLFNRSTKEVL